jgi:hypothetical protein
VRAVTQLVGTGSQAVSYMLGAGVVVLALIVMATSISAGEIAAWTHRVLGLTFVSMLSVLIFTALFSWVKLSADGGRDAADSVWLETGIQAANGVTTLALTYTLLGISLGIGSLAGKQLTPDTIQDVIQGLTQNFSLAFMTTVIGLPVSAALRALLLVTHARIRADGDGSPEPAPKT